MQIEKLGIVFDKVSASLSEMGEHILALRPWLQPEPGPAELKRGEQWDHGGQGASGTRRIRRPGGLGCQKGPGVQGLAELGAPEIGLTAWKNES